MPTRTVLRIAVCDDADSDRIAIAEMTKEILQTEGIAHSVTLYDSAKELLADMNGEALYHILILDVMMDDMDGITFSEQLRKWDDKTQIVFVSSNREMALRGYEVNAVRFLAKPAEEEKLREALLFCYRAWREKREIVIPTESGLRRTLLSEIIYAEAFDRGTRFVLSNDVIETKMKYSEAEELLPKPAFLLCHRGFIVNLAWTTYIRHYEFTLKNGNTVPIGKGRYAECHRLFLQYITE